MPRRLFLATGTVFALAACTDDPPAADGCIDGFPTPTEGDVPPDPRARPLPLSLHVSPDGSRVATASPIAGSSGLHVWDSQSGSIAWRRPEYGGRGPLSWLPDGRTVSYLSHEAAVFLDVGEGSARHHPHGHPVTRFDDANAAGAQAIALSADGELLVSVGHDLALKFFDATTCTHIGSADIGDSPGGFVSIGDEFVFVATASGIRVFDHEGRRKADLDDVEGPTRAPAFEGPQGGFVVVGTRSDYSFAVIDTDAWRFRKAFHEPHGQLCSVSPDGRSVAIYGTRPAVWIHQIDGEGRTEIALPSRPGGVAFGPDGTLLTTHLDEGVLQWALESGDQVRAFEKP